MKSQVTVEYKDGILCILIIVMAQLYDDKVTNEKIREDLLKYVVYPIQQKYSLSTQVKVPTTIINSSGRFVLGGPAGYRSYK